jgi:hypothetical protein
VVVFAEAEANAASGNKGENNDGGLKVRGFRKFALIFPNEKFSWIFLA